MKNTINTILGIALLMGIATSMQADPNFEFYNKDKANGRAKITLWVGNENIVNDKIVDSDEIYQATIDPQKNVTLIVFTVDQKYRYFTLNAPGKTKYLSWDMSKEPKPLYPQTGPLMGLMGRYNPFGAGKTETGLPLNNNVQNKQIEEKKGISNKRT